MPGVDQSGEQSRSRQERQVALQFRIDLVGVHFELVQCRRSGVQQSVSREEGVDEHHAARRGAAHITFVPLSARQRRGHHEMPVEHASQRGNPLARTGVDLVGHSRRPDLTCPETFRHETVTGHQAQSRSRRGSP